MYSSNNNFLTKKININTKNLVVNYLKQYSYFNKIIGYNKIK